MPAIRRAAIGLAALAGGTLLRCLNGNDSPGALDNASGLVALLEIARDEEWSDGLALLVTDAEEQCLAGAAAAREWLPEFEAVINLDGLDDEGEILLIDRYGWPSREAAPRVSKMIAATAADLGLRIVRRGLPVGVLADHLPLAHSGRPAVTIMRGRRRSLRRVHRPADRAERIRGRGIDEVIRLVSASLERFRGTTPTMAIAQDEPAG